MTKEQCQKLIAGASTVEQLNEVWERLSTMGYGTEGMMYASVLERKAALGSTLTDIETAQLNLAGMRRAQGEALPPIEGKGGLDAE